MPTQPSTETYDNYINQHFAAEDEVLREARAELARANMPIIHVSPSEGKILHVLAKLSGAKRILEIGTLGGYSAIWMARAMPKGAKLISLEINPHHADVARRNVERAHLSDMIEIICAPASETLRNMQKSEALAFDLIFIDADKDGYPEYLDLSMPLLREGGLLLGDNALSHSVTDPNTDNGITRFNKALAAHPDLTTIILPVLRSQGIDGLAVAIKQTQGA